MVLCKFQLLRSETCMRSTGKPNYRFELGRLDWDFDGDNTSEKSTGLHWYPARFLPQVPRLFIECFSNVGETVLDPFCGSGTTLVEAIGLGRNVIGVDNNPVATLISSAKVLEIDVRRFKEYAGHLLEMATDFVITHSARGTLPATMHFEENKRWYELHTLRELASLWAAILASPSPYQIIAKAAFSAILRFSCGYDKLGASSQGVDIVEGEPWDWICRNHRPALPVQKDAMTLFVQKLSDFAAATNELEERRRQVFPELRRGVANVLSGPCADSLTGVCDATVDLVVTSPPYFGFFDYAISQRLSFLWFDNVMESVNGAESGTRSKSFGKHSLIEFLSDMRASFAEVSRVLRRDGMCCVVIGEPPNCEPHLGLFARLLTDVGLQVEDRLSRDLPEHASLRTEEILILRRQ